MVKFLYKYFANFLTGFFSSIAELQVFFTYPEYKSYVQYMFYKYLLSVCDLSF